MKIKDLIERLKKVDPEQEIEYIIVTVDGQLITVELSKQTTTLGKFLQQLGAMS